MAAQGTANFSRVIIPSASRIKLSLFGLNSDSTCSNGYMDFFYFKTKCTLVSCHTLAFTLLFNYNFILFYVVFFFVFFVGGGSL